MPNRMPPFMKCIASGLAVAFLGSVVALACVHTPERPRELHGLRRFARPVKVVVKPIIHDLAKLVR